MEKWSGKPVSFADSTITGGFWKTEQDLCRKVTVNAVYDRFEETGRFEALKMQWKKGMPNQPHIFWESDVTKWIEGAAYFLKKERDPELEAKIDELVGRMERTQDTNGYLNAYFTVVEPKARFTRRTDHELYCAGHLIEGAIAYKEATGKDNMLRVAMKYADLIDRVFRVEHSAAFDTPEDLKAGNWASLDLYYQIRLKWFGEHKYEAVYLTVYPGELDTADSFPMEGQPVETMELDGTAVRYQQEQGYGARALFVSGGCTYEVGVSSRTDPDALTKYLQRLIR